MARHRYTWTQVILAAVVVVAGFLINWLFEMSALLLLALYVWLPPLRRFTYFPVVGQLSGLASLMTVGLLAVGVGTAGIALYPPSRAAPIPGPTVATSPSIGLATVATSTPTNGPPTAVAASPAPTPAILIPGQSGTIVVPPNGVRYLGMTSQDYYDLARAAQLNDRTGVLVMVGQGKIELVDRNTRVLVLDGTTCCPRLARVRIQDGPLFGDAVWLPPEYVQSGPTPTAPSYVTPTAVRDPACSAPTPSPEDSLGQLLRQTLCP